MGGVEPERAEDPPPAPTLRAIFAAEASYVAHSLRRLGADERDVEDLTHDVFVAVHRHLHEYDPARPLKPWLFGIAVRVALGYKRRARRHREVLGRPIEAVDEAPGADERLDEEKARRLVVRALAEVAAERRPVFILHEIDGCAMPEVARALGIPLNTGYSRLRLARAEFAAAVERLRRGGRP